MLHVHIYEDDQDMTLVEEIDASHVGSYDDYEQYGFWYEGKWLEIRVPKEK